ncbi:MAG TPA: Uma2 family endonuclease [Candidatus Polarisedimenticolaceae bacterium]|nr:Uma2 family endonuclease [Candidatus Polarisedimenticolaceae bacterium]
MPHVLERKLTYADLPEEPTDGKRYEIIRGRLYVTPAPDRAHQIISFRLERDLADYFEPLGLMILHAPIDMILATHDIFVPDIVVIDPVADDSKRGVERPPLLAVEILSPSTRGRDLNLKHRRYGELAIKHYWVVDPVERSVTCFKRHGDKYRIRVPAVFKGFLRHPDFDGMTINVGRIWPKPAS